MLNYFWLALNSFWAGRRDEDWGEPQDHGRDHNKTQSPYEESRARGGASRLGYLKSVAGRCDKFLRGGERFRTWFRRLLVCGCIIECAVFAGLAIWRQNYAKWDRLESGRCYIAHGKAAWQSDWFWLAGVCVYATVLLLSLVSKTRLLLSSYSEKLHAIEDFLFRLCIGKWRELAIVLRSRRSLPMWASKAAIMLGTLLPLLFSILCYTAFVQFMAIWSFGDGFYVLEVAFYLAMWMWSFFDIVDLKVSNEYLIEGSEMTWGFGQVLAVVLMDMVIFNLVDALNGKDAPTQLRTRMLIKVEGTKRPGLRVPGASGNRRISRRYTR